MSGFQSEITTVAGIVAPWSNAGGRTPAAAPGRKFDPSNAVDCAPFAAGGPYVRWVVRNAPSSTVAKGNGTERMYHGVVIAQIFVPEGSSRAIAGGAGRAAELADLWSAQFDNLGQVNGISFEPPGWAEHVGSTGDGFYQLNVNRPFRRRRLMPDPD